MAKIASWQLQDTNRDRYDRHGLVLRELKTVFIHVYARDLFTWHACHAHAMYMPCRMAAYMARSWQDHGMSAMSTAMYMSWEPCYKYILKRP